MPLKLSKANVDSQIRAKIFEALNVANAEGFSKINDRQYGVLVEDAEGHQRYARVAVIVAEEREDMTAEELMRSEVEKYETSQRKKAEQKAAREEKARKDAEKRKQKEKEGT